MIKEKAPRKFSGRFILQSFSMEESMLHTALAEKNKNVVHVLQNRSEAPGAHDRGQSHAMLLPECLELIAQNLSAGYHRVN